ncbi:DUF4179 domain-containing protein [Mesobacillus selenatarsenatis]|uniref:DUF4179 domain-containing protein n=1 Tax=Mesobacillus selenatarsenatis (strain DSM 18680 / JCM 14380 / FERM P-15431 / SF-1) TaxID=1321606 RepID=A0A0A8X7R8_MESS1|nr:DUF4179 domain-containing protein [Mesobacillus selenatarsenatis]GAM15087.1 BH3497 unknown [Mesobacillus selenatarsenatis SF-1]
MIPEMESITIATIQEKGIDSVVGWFDRHKQSFYGLGWFYLQNQQQMEELFYRSIIKVHKELPRYKRDTSFELWVTSIFIDNCRELSQAKALQSSEEIIPHKDLFKALNLLEDDEKEAMILTYGAGFSQKEAAQILRVSVGKLKELMYSGVKSVRKQLDRSTYNGCKEYQNTYIDYLEKTMERPGKIEFEMHIYNCRECQEDLAAFQDVTIMLNHAEWMNDLPVPEHLIANIKERFAEKEQHRQQKFKKLKKSALVFVSVFAIVIGIGFFTDAFANVYYTWTEEDEQLRTFLQQDLGQRVNLEAESDGVKIKIKGVVADDAQTLVFYEIEDTKGDNKYLMSYEDGLYVENEYQIMKSEAYPRYSFSDLDAEINKRDKNVFYGKVSLKPLEEDEAVIKLKITQVQELVADNNEAGMEMGFRTNGYKSGEWKFEIPATKQPSTEIVLTEQTVIEGIPIRLEKLTIAPTATILQYGIREVQLKKRIDFLNLGDLEVNGKKVKVDQYGSVFSHTQQDMDWRTYQTQFDSFFGEEPEELKIHFETAYFTFEDHKSVELDVDQPLPQTFEYAGSKISIDEIEVGQPTSVVISNHEVADRAFEALHLNIFGENEHETISTGMEQESVLVDKNGVIYDPYSDPVDYEKIEEPRHFVTVQTITLDGENVVPKRLEIYGYNSMRYLGDVMKITLK